MEAKQLLENVLRVNRMKAHAEEMYNLLNEIDYECSGGTDEDQALALSLALSKWDMLRAKIRGGE